MCPMCLCVAKMTYLLFARYLLIILTQIWAHNEAVHKYVVGEVDKMECEVDGGYMIRVFSNQPATA
jgi:hypothetical protein